ncbi:hypothetical protein SAMN02745229_04132, partial [Butyrivibrio fibrisolvens DSM 3071]
MLDNLIIRAEEPADYKNTELMAMRSFFNKYGPAADEQGNSFDALMVLPLNNDFSNIKGKLIESKDFEKLEDKERLAKINEEFPKYRVVKVQEGFMQIFEQHLGVVEAVEDDTYMVRYWELLIPAKLSENLGGKPEAGSDVQFMWNHKGESQITKVCELLRLNATHLKSELPASTTTALATMIRNSMS